MTNTVANNLFEPEIFVKKENSPPKKYEKENYLKLTLHNGLTISRQARVHHSCSSTDMLLGGESSSARTKNSHTNPLRLSLNLKWPPTSLRGPSQWAWNKTMVDITTVPNVGPPSDS